VPIAPTVKPRHGHGDDKDIDDHDHDAAHGDAKDGGVGGGGGHTLEDHGGAQGTAASPPLSTTHYATPCRGGGRG
jgi:hypothetical protein